MDELAMESSASIASGTLEMTEDYLCYNRARV